MLTPIIYTLLFVLGLIFVYMTIWFVTSLILKRNDIADIAWGLGFIVVAWAVYLRNTMSPSPQNTTSYIIIALLTTIWGLRLAIHIFLRNKDKKEDYRYKEMREKWGGQFLINSYLRVFLSQGFLMALVSMSAIIGSLYYGPLTILDYVGILIWLIGFIFESVGDYQLSKFISKPENKGEIMTKGLWRYTRHPNYFGEVTQWWGIFLIAVSFSSPITLVALISPLTITYLILKVSGIPMLEEKYEDNKEFQKYKKRTNAFFPWFPKKKEV